MIQFDIISATVENTNENTNETVSRQNKFSNPKDLDNGHMISFDAFPLYEESRHINNRAFDHQSVRDLFCCNDG